MSTWLVCTNCLNMPYIDAKKRTNLLTILVLTCIFRTSQKFADSNDARSSPTMKGHAAGLFVNVSVGLTLGLLISALGLPRSMATSYPQTSKNLCVGVVHPLKIIHVLHQ